VNLKKIIPDEAKSIKKGGIAPIGEYRANWIFNQLEMIGQKYGFRLNTPISDIPEEAISTILYGSNETFIIKKEFAGVTSSYTLNFEGIINFITNQFSDSNSRSIQKWAGSFMNRIPCPECEGDRLKKESLHFRIGEKNISELACMDLVRFNEWMDGIAGLLDEKKQTIAREIVREIKTRTGFLLEVGLDYLSLNRPARSLSGGESQRIRLATQMKVPRGRCRSTFFRLFPLAPSSNNSFPSPYSI